MRLTKRSTVSVLLASGLFICAGQAQALTINDTTDNVSYQGGSPTGYFGGSSTGDFIGADFDTQKADVNVTSTGVTFRFYTKFGGSDLGAHYADLFIATDPLDPDNYNYGIALGYQQGYGGVAAGLYQISAGDFQTSIDRWTGTGYIYGGQYVSPNDGLDHDAPTVVTGGAPVSGWSVTASSSASGDPSYPYYFDVTLTADDTSTFFDVFADLGLSAFWGTGDCDNDAVYMTRIEVPPNTRSVPEPATLALFGAGLVGFGAMRRRKSA